MSPEPVNAQSLFLRFFSATPHERICAYRIVFRAIVYSIYPFFKPFRWGVVWITEETKLEDKRIFCFIPAFLSLVIFDFSG